MIAFVICTMVLSLYRAWMPEHDFKVSLSTRETQKLSVTDCRRMDRGSDRRKISLLIFPRNGIPSGCMLEVVDDADAAKLMRKGETLTAAVERYRAQLRELQGQVRKVREAPYPSSDVKARLHSQISALAEQGRPNVAAAIKSGQQIGFAMTSLSSMVRGGDKPMLAFTETTDSLSLLCYLFREQIIKKLGAEVDTASDDENALSEAEREKRDAEIMARHLQVERSELALIWHAEAQGEIIDFRPDTTPQAVLGLQLITTPPRPIAGTTLGHTFSVNCVG